MFHSSLKSQISNFKIDHLSMMPMLPPGLLTLQPPYASDHTHMRAA
jgi:hypothetical protein